MILIWSNTPLAIKWRAQGIGSSFAVLSRMGVGALLCVLLLVLLRVSFSLHRKAWLGYLASGLNNEAVLPHVWLGTASMVPGLCTHRWGGQWSAYLLSCREGR